MKQFTLGFEFQFLDLSFLATMDLTKEDLFVWNDDDVVRFALTDTLSVYADELTSENPWVHLMKRKLFLNGPRGTNKINLTHAYCRKILGSGQLCRGETLLLETEEGRVFSMRIDHDLFKNFNEAEFLALDPRVLRTECWSWSSSIEPLVRQEIKTHLEALDTWWSTQIERYTVTMCQRTSVEKRIRNVSPDMPWKQLFCAKPRYPTTNGTYTLKPTHPGRFQIGFMTMDPTFCFKDALFHVQATMGVEVGDLLPLLGHLCIGLLEIELSPQDSHYLDETLVLLHRCLKMETSSLIRSVLFSVLFADRSFHQRKHYPFLIRHRTVDLVHTFLLPLRRQEVEWAIDRHLTEEEGLSIYRRFHEPMPHTLEERERYHDQYGLTGSTIFPVQNGNVLVEIRYLQSLLSKGNTSLMTRKSV
jgi:hypothetical protein